MEKNIWIKGKRSISHITYFEPSEVGYQARQKGAVRHTMADMTKAKEKPGYKPKVSII